MAKLRENAVIYDFETMSKSQSDGVVINFAVLSYDERRFADNPYTFNELVDNASLIKFDVKEQVKKYNRKIDKETMEWWMKQNETAKKCLKPSDDDKSISELYEFCMGACPKADVVYTRGNTFDPLFLAGIMDQTGYPEPWPWWLVRDTRSFIEGATVGCDVNNSFDPPGCEGFIHHDPIHDIAKDVMRMQYLVSSLLGNK